jgi:flavin reductase (DIM6/NTAB) family NADH-FMN oxidoreductase RutF
MCFLHYSLIEPFYAIAHHHLRLIHGMVKSRRKIIAFLEEHMAISHEDLRHVMRSWTSGVTVVAARYEDQLQGMTVSSFTSISLDPPRVIVSLERSTRTCESAVQSGHFGVTILSSDQDEISDRFAGRMPEMDNKRFEGLAVETMKSGSPFIVGGIAYLDCRIVDTHDIGANTLLIGEVIAACTTEEDKPLVYFNQDYRSLK